MLNLKKWMAKVSDKLAELNSISGMVPVTLRGVANNLVYTKSGNVVAVSIVLGNNTMFSGFNGMADIGTLPSNLRPKQDSHLTGMMRTEGSWAAATYYICDVFVSASSGVISVRGTSNIANCKYLVVNGCYVI